MTCCITSFAVTSVSLHIKNEQIVEASKRYTLFIKETAIETSSPQ